MTHCSHVAICSALYGVVFGAGVDNAEEGKHGLGLVAGFAEETTIIIIRVRVGGGIDQAERLEGGDG